MSSSQPPSGRANGTNGAGHPRPVTPVSGSPTLLEIPAVAAGSGPRTLNPPPPPNPAVAVRAYEDLDAGTGREVFFRPKRFTAEDLAPLEAEVQLTIRGLPRSATFLNLSRSGVAVDVPQDATLTTGTPVRLVLGFGGLAIYDGNARIERVVPSGDQTMVGLSFDEALVEMDELLRLRHLKLWNAGSGPGHRVSRQAFRTEGHEQFKALVGELRLFLDDAQKELADLEQALPPEAVHGEADSLVRHALVPMVEQEFVARFTQYTEQIDAGLRSATGRDWHALKEYSVRHLHPSLMQAPAMHRAFTKPAGYPGDHELLNYFYERNWEGRSLFARALHLAACNSGVARGVRGRKDALRAELAKRVRNATHLGRPLRVLSVAAGPAQEIYEWLRDLTASPVPIEIVLFDQDHDALTFAYKRLKALTDARKDNFAELLYLHDSIKRLMTDENIFLEFGKFDAVLCAGFCDYLAGPRTVQVARTLCKYAAPGGGTVYLGNQVPQSPARWLMEHHLDWYLIYKSRDELLALAHEAMPGWAIDILDDPSGINPFVTLTRT